MSFSFFTRFRHGVLFRFLMIFLSLVGAIGGIAYVWEQSIEKAEVNHRKAQELSDIALQRVLEDNGGVVARDPRMAKALASTAVGEGVYSATVTVTTTDSTAQIIFSAIGTYGGERAVQVKKIQLHRTIEGGDTLWHP